MPRTASTFSRAARPAGVRGILNGGFSRSGWMTMMRWLNEPPYWQATDDSIHVRAAAQTDFWRKTHADFIAHNGHFYYQQVDGDFIARTAIRGQYRAQYDQAGLMIRLDDQTWLKCGIELLDGVQQASAVLTRDYSDWSVVSLPDAPPVVWFALKRSGHTVEVAYSPDGVRYTLIRQGYFPPVGQVQVGVMCCAPTGEGFDVTFREFAIAQPD